MAGTSNKADDVVNIRQMNNGICDDRLIAVAHIKGVRTLQMDKGSIRYSSLTAVTHVRGVVQGVDTLYVSESGICNDGFIATANK